MIDFLFPDPKIRGIRSEGRDSGNFLFPDPKVHDIRSEERDLGIRSREEIHRIHMSRFVAIG